MSQSLTHFQYACIEYCAIPLSLWLIPFSTKNIIKKLRKIPKETVSEYGYELILIESFSYFVLYFRIISDQCFDNSITDVVKYGVFAFFAILLFGYGFLTVTTEDYKPQSVNIFTTGTSIFYWSIIVRVWLIGLMIFNYELTRTYRDVINGVFDLSFVKVLAYILTPIVFYFFLYRVIVDFLFIGLKRILIHNNDREENLKISNRQIRRIILRNHRILRVLKYFNTSNYRDLYCEYAISYSSFAQLLRKKRRPLLISKEILTKLIDNKSMSGHFDSILVIKRLVSILCLLRETNIAIEYVEKYPNCRIPLDKVTNNEYVF